MDPSDALLFSASGAILGVIGRIVYDWLRNPRAASNGNGNRAMAQDILAIRKCQEQCRCGEQVAWLKEMHSKTDANGLPLFYFPHEIKRQSEENNRLVLQGNQHLLTIKEILLKNNELLDRIDRKERN